MLFDLICIEFLRTHSADNERHCVLSFLSIMKINSWNDCLTHNLRPTFVRSTSGAFQCLYSFLWNWA
jgi:hypothetical protein